MPEYLELAFRTLRNWQTLHYTRSPRYNARSVSNYVLITITITYIRQKGNTTGRGQTVYSKNNT